jgi:DNA-binding transcriptional LysR family regulator
VELQTLRYFLAVAEVENVHRAAEAYPISPGSLTKAVQRLEGELGVKLFERVGRNIRLTEQGRQLRVRARELLGHEETIRLEVGGADQPVHVVVTGEEAVLGGFAPAWMSSLRDRLPGVTFELRAARPEDIQPQLTRGEAQVGITTRAVPRDLAARPLGEVKFVTCVAPSHPLGGGKRRRRIAVSRLLEHGFVVPGRPFLGAVDELQATDGWRDDAFPRQVLVRAETLHQLLAVVSAGLTVAYLPDYLARDRGLEVLTVTGCDYVCTQPVHLVHDPRRVPTWLEEFPW